VHGGIEDAPFRGHLLQAELAQFGEEQVVGHPDAVEDRFRRGARLAHRPLQVVQERQDGLQQAFVAERRLRFPLARGALPVVVELGRQVRNAVPQGLRLVRSSGRRGLPGFPGFDGNPAGIFGGVIPVRRFLLLIFHPLALLFPVFGAGERPGRITCARTSW
jgi:hypothetical protein